MTPRPTRPAPSPLRGRYLVRNPLWNGWLRVNDLVLAATRPRARDAARHDETPKRVLVAVGGHLGDAVIASSFLPQLSRAFPGVEAGIVCASWNRRAFESHPRVRWIHTVDHWKLDRAGAPLVTRWLATRRTRSRALAEIRATGYDAAIDLSAYYPNSAWLLWRAGVPVRIGYTSGGDGPLFTHPVAWLARDHVADEHSALLAPLAPSFRREDAARYELPEIPRHAAASAERKLSARGTRPETYVVMHMGAGHPRKEWPLEKWIAVARGLAALGVDCVLTGSGKRQTEQAREVAERVKSAATLSDELDWDEFRAVIAQARMVISVDTVAMHLAGAAGTPCVALMTGMDKPNRWRPLGSPATVLTEPVLCAPCFRSRGCDAMSCVRDVTSDTVLDAARGYLGSSAL